MNLSVLLISIRYILPLSAICIFYIGCTTSSSSTVSEDTTQNLITSDTTVRQLADGFSFTEGPAADAKGNVYFTDQPNDKIYIWTTSDSLEVFLDSSQRSNGLFFDQDGTLLACADRYNRLIAIDQQGNMKTLAEGYEGKRLNGPNDLWPDSKGGIYFTDPFYKRPWWNHDATEQDGMHVYYLQPDRKTLTRVAEGLVTPNGIIGSADGKTLYVADIKDGKTYAYDIQDDGTLQNRRQFAPEGSDGMTIDEQGNIYLTTDAVKVYNPEGVLIHTIQVPERPANVCFGEADKSTLFITARKGLYAISMNVKGIY